MKTISNFKCQKLYFSLYSNLIIYSLVSHEEDHPKLSYSRHIVNLFILNPNCNENK